MTGSEPIVELARLEIAALHAFFVEWFTAEGGKPTPDFAACEGALAADFVMVTPDGARHGRAIVLDRLRRARGTIPGGFAITIADARPVWSAGDAVLMHYIERQALAPRTTERRSSALLTRAQGAPRGLHWRFLQETWMIAADPASV